MEGGAEKSACKKVTAGRSFQTQNAFFSRFYYSGAAGSSPSLLDLVCSDFSIGGCSNFGFFRNHDRWVFLCKRYFHMRAGSEPGIIGPWEAKGFRFLATAVFNDTFPHTRLNFRFQLLFLTTMTNLRRFQLLTASRKRHYCLCCSVKLSEHSCHWFCENCWCLMQKSNLLYLCAYIQI